MTCVDENSIVAFVEEDLADEDKAVVERHIARCGRCRRLLSEAIKLEHPCPPGSAEVAGAGLRKGDAVGRYRVVDIIGAGAMGLVYAAQDPMLHRQIAIKLMRSHARRDPSAGERMEREAHALARLSHPNVVNVYDVGEHGGALFIAMEYVEGQTLGAWCRSQGPGWEEIREVFAQAGRGLAAAHAAGVVHRDFKPENVLIGDDGRARVSDFGLAGEAIADEDVAPAAAASADPLDAVSLTQTGSLLGTPAYMAPAQRRGQPANAASDQYSFCVALYEALCGKRPFACETAEEEAGLAAHGSAPSLPADVSVPRWLRRIVLRGLSREEGARFASMEELVGELERQRPRRLRIAIGVSLMLALGGSSLALMAGAANDRSEHACQGGLARWGSAWSDGGRESLRDSFAATALPYAEQAVQATEQALDAYQEEWLAVYQRACQATHVYRDQSDATLDLQMACLEQKRHELKALVGILGEADASIVQRASQAVGALSSPRACSNASALQAVVARPDDSQVSAQIDRFREELAVVQAMKHSGQYEAALDKVQLVIGRASSVSFDPLSAELFLEHCELLSFKGDNDRAEASCLRSVSLADSGHHDRVRARAAIYLLYIVGYKGQRHREGHQWAQLAHASLKRSGARDELLGLYHTHLGALQIAEGDYRAALESFQTSYEIYQEHLGLHHPSTATVFENIGIAYGKLGEPVRALEHAELAVAGQVEALGNWHPVVGRARYNLGISYFDLGKYRMAIEELEESLENRMATIGPEHLSISSTLNGLGNVHLKLGEYGRAEEYFQRALTMSKKLEGERGSQAASRHNNLAIVYRHQGNYELALEHAELAVAIWTETSGADHPDTAEGHSVRAQVWLAMGRRSDAGVGFRRAVRILEDKLGPEHPALVLPLLGLAAIHLDLGEPSQALEPARRAEALTASIEGDPVARSRSGLALARALWDARLDRKSAIATAKKASTSLDGAEGAVAEELRTEIAAWLARHETSAP